MATSSEIVVREIPEITKILKYEMRNEMSEHPYAKVVCEVSQSFRLQALANHSEQIHIERIDTREIAFTGYLTDVALEEEVPAYSILEFCLVGGSILLDQCQKERSYQNISWKHGNIIEKVAKDTAGITLKCEPIDDCVIEKPLIQYEETDWEFIKRVASRINEPTFVDETAIHPCIHVGRKSGYATGRVLDARCISEGMDARFYGFGELSKASNRAYYYFYKLSSGDNYYLGEQVVYGGEEYYICEKEAALEQEELCYTYKLVRDAFMKIPPMYNPRFVGASILGTIKAVRGETMELKLSLRDDEGSTVRYAYDWKPEVGNLMYCMPKVETEVSLYFPSHDEQEAYAVNCVRKISAEREKLLDASAKTFLTEDSKLLALVPSAVQLCAVNSESDNDYAQLSMIDAMEKEGEAEVTDIVEKMGTMLASSFDISIASGTGIHLEGTYVDLIAGGRIRVMTGVTESGGKAKASIEVAAAYFSITAEGLVRFVLLGKVGENTFCLIEDVPKTAANGWLLARNFVIGLAVVAIVALTCLFALPAVLGLIGVATATASAIAMGAAVGAAATGVFAIVEQTQKDIENGEVSSWGDTIKNVGIKSVAGAIEGGFMAVAGAGSLVTQGGRFLSMQTLKNVGKNLVINQIGSAISATGNVLADSVTGDGITGEEAINYYVDGFVSGLFSSTLDIGKEIPWKKIPGVEKASKWVSDKVIDKVKTWVTDRSLYQKFQTKIERLMKWGSYYGEYDKYGTADAQLEMDINYNRNLINTREVSANAIENQVDDYTRRYVDGGETIDNFNTERAEIAEQLKTLVRGADEETDRLIDTLIARDKYLSNQVARLSERVAEANMRLQPLSQRLTNVRNSINALYEQIEDDKTTRIVDKLGTFTVCSFIKFVEDRANDLIQYPAKEEAKDIVQDLFLE